MTLSLAHKKRLAILAFVVLTIAFFYLLYLPVDYFDEGRSLCLSVILLDKKCYGCGMTRAIHHLLHGDIKGAWAFNKFSFIVLPLAIYMISTSLLKVIRQKDRDSEA